MFNAIRGYGPLASSLVIKFSTATTTSSRSGILPLAKRMSTATSPFTTFPFTLMRLNPGPNFKLLLDKDRPLFEKNVAGSLGNMVVGLPNAKPKQLTPDIHADIRGTWIEAVAIDFGLRRNLYPWQYIVRTAVDDYHEDIDDGKLVEMPFVFTIPKGTPVPTDLALTQEKPVVEADDELSLPYDLRPSSLLRHKDPLLLLAQFYSTHAEITKASEWTDSHPFGDRIGSCYRVGGPWGGEL